METPAARPVRPRARLAHGTRESGAGGAGAARELFRRLDAKILAGIDRHLIPGAAVAVLYDGQEHVRGFGVTDVRYPVPVDADTLFRIGSTSKTFTGTAVMRLVDGGHLDLDAPVRRYLPDLIAPPGAREVTVRQLLNHSAGWLGEDYADTGRGWDALAKYTAGLARLPQLTAPGETFSYNNAALVLAGRVVERVAGDIFEFAMQELVLEPLGLDHTFYFSDEIIGYNVAAGHAVAGGRPVVKPRYWYLPRSLGAAGGLISSARDQLRYARFHLGDGRGAEGHCLLSARSLELMRSEPGPGGTLNVELTGMGVTWQLRPSAEGVPIVQHGGDVSGQRSGFLMVPERGFAMTLLTNAESGSALVGELFTDDWALREFTGLTNLPTPERVLAPRDLAAYCGRYRWQEVGAGGRLTDLAPVTIEEHDGGLLVTSGRGPSSRRSLLTFYDSPFGTDYVLVKDGAGTPTGARADFIRDGSGAVRWFRLGGRLLRHLA